MFIITILDLQQNSLTIFLMQELTVGKFNIRFLEPSIWNSIDNDVKVIIHIYVQGKDKRRILWKILGSACNTRFVKLFRMIYLFLLV